MKLKINIEPSPIPDPLRVGEPLLVKVDSILENGVGCYACNVRWNSSQPLVARWTGMGAAGSVQMGTLQPIAPGEIILTIDVCPGVAFACERTVVTRRVVARRR